MYEIRGLDEMRDRKAAELRILGLHYQTRWRNKYMQIDGAPIVSLPAVICAQKKRRGS